MNIGILILSGYNIRAVIAFCRFAKSHALPFYIIASGPNDPIFQTDYKDNVHSVRSSANLIAIDFCKTCEEIRNKYKHERILLIPSSEAFNRFLLQNRGIIENEGNIIPLVSRELYETISDKYHFGELCRKNGIDIPLEFKVMPDSPPFAAKPKSYASASGRQLKPYLIIQPSDYLSFVESEVTGDYYFQEFLGGESHYLLAYISNKQKHVLYSQKNLIQQARGDSIILSTSSSFHQTKEALMYVQMLERIKFQGLIMVEVKYWSNRYFMIEANPRLWGPLQFSLDNQAPILHQFISECGMNIRSYKDNGSRRPYYFWSGGINRWSYPLAYHGYSPSGFMNDYPDILACDIFLRCDTENLYLSEMKSIVGI